MDLARAGVEAGLEGLARRHGAIGPCHPDGRRLQRAEGVLGRHGEELSRHAARPPVGIGHDQPPRAANGGQQRLAVEGPQSAEIEDLGRDALAGQRAGGLERFPDVRTYRRHRDIVPRAHDGGLADRHFVVAVRHLAVLFV